MSDAQIRTKLDQSQNIFHIKNNDYSTIDASVMKKMDKFLEVSNTLAPENKQVTKEEMNIMLFQGEKIAKSLAKNTQPECHSLKDAAALTWFLMCLAAKNNEEHTSGTFRIDDPDRAIFNFINSCKGEEKGQESYGRISTHFEVHNAFLQGEKQRGIDVPGLPCGKNTLLFSVLPDATTFIKIEDHGCPPFWEKNFQSKEKFSEFVGHSTDFIKSRFVKASSIYASRREDITEDLQLKFARAMLGRDVSDLSKAKKVLEKASDVATKKLVKDGIKLGVSQMSATLKTVQNDPKFSARSEVAYLDSELGKIIIDDRRKGYAGERQGSEVTLPPLKDVFNSIS